MKITIEQYLTSLELNPGDHYKSAQAFGVKAIDSKGVEITCVPPIVTKEATYTPTRETYGRSPVPKVKQIASLPTYKMGDLNVAHDGYLHLVVKLHHPSKIHTYALVSKDIVVGSNHPAYEFKRSATDEEVAVFLSQTRDKSLKELTEFQIARGSLILERC